MKLRYGVSPAAIELIKRFEGFHRTAAPIGDGRWAIGYGHTRSAREGAEVTEADAEALLGFDLVDVQAAVNDWTYTPLTQNQFDALVSFVFNIGLDAFRHSAVLRRVNEGALLQAACTMEMWRKADFDGQRIVVDALIRRRAAEKALFLTPPEGFVAAPSAVVRPQLDYDARAAVPRVRPAELASEPESAATTPVAQPEPSDPALSTSTSERAAAAVSARLQAILPNEGPPQAAEAPSVDDEPQPFPGADSDAAATAPAPERIAEPIVRPSPRASPATFASVRSIFEDTHEDADQPSFTPLVILGLIGLVFFGGGLFWIFAGRAGGGLLGPGAGFAAGLIGILCLAGTVYFFLDRLADRD